MWSFWKLTWSFWFYIHIVLVIKSFWLLSNYFWSFYWFCFFFFFSFALLGLGVFSVNLVANNCRFSFSDFLLNNCFLCKSSSFITVFKDKVSWVHWSSSFLQHWQYWGYTWLYQENKKSTKQCLIWMKNSIEKWRTESYFESKNNIISINLDQSNNCCLYSPKIMI